MELKLKYTREDVDKIGILLRKVLISAEENYKRKKKIKGEKVDYWKMMKAINQRKDCKRIAALCLASHLSLGNILDQPAVNRAVESLERKYLLEGTNESKDQQNLA